MTNSQLSTSSGLPVLARREFRKKLDEGPTERQEDLRQVQGDSPARSRDGDLRESAAQAATGLGRDNSATPMKLRASVSREQLQESAKCDRKSADECRRIHPRSEAEAPVIRPRDLIKGSRGRITPDTSATACGLRPWTGSGRTTVDQTKGNTPDGTPYWS